MVITFDPSKDRLNRSKHGVSLSAASQFDWDSALVWPDLRYHYTELRECALGFIGNHLYFLVFTAEADVIRVISLRRANKEEGTQYVRQKT
ncbi:BrnT family toxin [Duganella sp. FT94W]|uniref:BrnT family toxin n=1 Tax=Duganella lactea TaxID=2692173 RepID=A0ABW9V4W4_9BURK|nr:BrnT family toxin [Duganella lactea]MYM33657.1 BrnT family toxin [Duganella lactea]